MARRDLPIVRRHSCPQCDGIDSLYVVDRVFSYRPIAASGGKVTVSPRHVGKFVQEAALLCRSCEWVHDLRHCEQTIDSILSGEAKCSHA